MTHCRPRLKYAGSALAAVMLLAALWPPTALADKKVRLDLSQVLSHMDESGKRLKTISADLEYTKVTVLVNDKSSDAGQISFRNSKSPEILIDFINPDRKVILLKKDKAEIYLPKINQIQEYDLSRHEGVVQQFLLLGFGSRADDLRKAYDIKYLSEEELDHAMTAVLELIPRQQSVASQLARIQLWISEESWLPVQQKFFEPNGDYSIAHYTAVKINRNIPSSVFRIRAAKDAKRVKM